MTYNILILCINWPALYVEIEERRAVENAEAQRILLENLAQSSAVQGEQDDYERVKESGDNEVNSSNKVQ